LGGAAPNPSRLRLRRKPQPHPMRVPKPTEVGAGSRAACDDPSHPTMAAQLSDVRDTSESGARLILITAGIMAATLMQTLDTTIVNVALPTIQGNLGATLDEGAWVVTGYIISAVVVIPMTPWLQARFGRRQYYSTAIIGFTIASILCGLASSIDQLIFYRIVPSLAARYLSTPSPRRIASCVRARCDRRTVGGTDGRRLADR
jgi:hypothetical protein